MTSPCDFRQCHFINEEDDTYSAFCCNCGRRDPMAELVLTVMEREAEAMDELDRDWQEVRVGFARRAKDGRTFTIDVEGFVPVVWESEGRSKRRVGEFSNIAQAVIAARAAERAPYEDEPPF